jgi:hypothetical protein
MMANQPIACAPLDLSRCRRRSAVQQIWWLLDLTSPGMGRLEMCRAALV